MTMETGSCTKRTLKGEIASLSESASRLVDMLAEYPDTQTSGAQSAPRPSSGPVEDAIESLQVIRQRLVYVGDKLNQEVLSKLV